MTLIRINTQGSTLLDPRDGSFEAKLDRLQPGQPVVILIHGFKYDPDVPLHDPHQLILSPTPLRAVPRTISWPHHLGFTRPSGPPGVCITFGWPARGSIFRARRRSAPAAQALAALIRRVHARAPLNPIHLMAHSLGARVALSALHEVPIGAVGRIILMAAAAFQRETQMALSTPAGRAAEVFNITSRENDLYDLMLEGLFLQRTLGQGLARPRPNWIDVQIDNAQTRAALHRLGFPTRPPAARICHWSSYLRPGLFAFYRRILFAPEAMTMAEVRQQLPRQSEPRLARLRDVNLPFRPKARP